MPVQSNCTRNHRSVKGGRRESRRVDPTLPHRCGLPQPSRKNSLAKRGYLPTLRTRQNHQTREAQCTPPERRILRQNLGTVNRQTASVSRTSRHVMQSVARPERGLCVLLLDFVHQPNTHYCQEKADGHERGKGNPEDRCELANEVRFFFWYRRAHRAIPLDP